MNKITKADLMLAIAEAHEYSEDVDSFDLHSENPESMREFEALEKDAEASLHKLIAICKQF